jgi:hypothetical protein
MDPFSCYEIGPLLFPHYFDTHLLKLGPLLVTSFKFSPLLSVLLLLLLTYFELNLLLLLCSFCYLLALSLVLCRCSFSFSTYLFQICLSCFEFCEVFFYHSCFHWPPTSRFIFCLYFPSFPLCKFGNLEHYSPLHCEVLGPIVVATFFLLLFLGFVCSSCLHAWSICMHVCLVS